MSSLLENAIQGRFVSSKRKIFELGKFNYFDIALLFKCDNDLAHLRHIIKKEETSGEQLLQIIRTKTVPITWQKYIKKQVQKKFVQLCDEINNILDGPPPSETNKENTEMGLSPIRPMLKERRRSSTGSIGTRSSNPPLSRWSVLPLTPGPMDLYITRVEDNENLKRRQECKSVEYPSAASIIDHKRAKFRKKALFPLKSNYNRPIAILSYSSGINKAEFTKWMDITSRNIFINGISLACDDEETSETKNSCPNHGRKNQEIIRFMKEPKYLEHIKYLVIDENQVKPTLKILYTLATKGYILNHHFIQKAKQNKKWPNPVHHQHSGFPTLQQREEMGSKPLGGFKIGLFGEFGAPSIPKVDIVKLGRLLGAEISQTRDKFRDADLVIVSDNLNKLENLDLLLDLAATDYKGQSKNEACTNMYCSSEVECKTGHRHSPFYVTALWLIETVRFWQLQNVAGFVPVVVRALERRSKPSSPSCSPTKTQRVQRSSEIKDHVPDSIKNDRSESLKRKANEISFNSSFQPSAGFTKRRKRGENSEGQMQDDFTSENEDERKEYNQPQKSIASSGSFNDISLKHKDREMRDVEQIEVTQENEHIYGRSTECFRNKEDDDQVDCYNDWIENNLAQDTKDLVESAKNGNSIRKHDMNGILKRKCFKNC